MEEQGNIMLVCRECSDKMYPNKGTFDVNIGDIVKLKFTDGNGAEYMWVEVSKVDKEDNKYEGRLDNDPVLVECVKCGDNISFGKDDILQVHGRQNNG